MSRQQVIKRLVAVIFIIFGLIFFSGPSLLLAQDVEALINQGTELIQSRHLDPENLSRAIETYQQALDIEPNNATALWHMAEAYYCVGDEEAATKEEKLAAYQKGLDYAERAVKVNPEDADAHYWIFANKGRIGETKGVLASLFMIPHLKKELEAIFAIDPDHVRGLEAQGYFYCEIPGGDLDKSIESLQKAISIDPNFTIAYVDLARSLIKKKKYIQAREALNAVLNCETPTYPADYALHDKLEAEELLKELEGKI